MEPRTTPAGVDTKTRNGQQPPRVLVLADVESNARALVERVLKPAGIHAWAERSEGPPPDVLVVDVTQLRGDPLAGLQAQRSRGVYAPAIVLAAHFPHARLRDMFRLGVRDFLLKPYRPEALCKSVFELTESRSPELDTHILTRRLETTREQVRQRSEEIRMLSEIGRVVASLGDLDAILRRVVEAAAFVTGAEEASIYLVENETNELVLRASKQVGQRHATLQRLRVNDTLAGEVLMTGRPILRQPMDEGGPVKVQTGFVVKSLVKVPLRVRNNVVGVLGIYNRMASRPFSEHHLTLLTSLAHWAGVALEQASLIQQASSSSRRTITAAPPTLMDGLDRAIQALDSMIHGSREPLRDSVRQTLSALRRYLQELRDMPMATLDSEEAQEMIDIPGLLHEVAQEMHPAAAHRGLDLIAESGSAIPLFRGDPARTRRIVEALVSAAIRRTRRGRIVLEAHRIEIHGGQSDALPLPDNVQLEDGVWAVVRVSDTSPGLSPNTVRAITAGTTDPAAGQMGPGLSLGEIRMILESMGGTMWYEHTPASTTILFALRIS